MASIHRRDREWLWSVAFCGLFMVVCGAVWLAVTLDWTQGPSEAELQGEGWPYCSTWDGHLGIDEEAQCIYGGELVKYWDTDYAASLRYARDYAESVE